MDRARAALAFGLLIGCDGFDPQLYERALTQSVADQCREPDVPLLVSSQEFMRLDLSDFDDTWQVANCAEGSAPGNDAFFGVDMERGQKFHFHVNALDAVDPIVYVVDSCDERVCQPFNAASRCPSDKEHLSFVAPRTGRYYVGIDGADPGGGNVELLALSAVCGDGDKQHSEACDDGNADAHDGCDASCRIELPASDRIAQEPNDDLATGNVLALGPALRAFRVHGTLESACDPEVFTFALPEAASVSLRVLDPAGRACDALHPEQRVELELFEGLTPIAFGQPTDDNACPELPAGPLQAGDVEHARASDAGTYHVRVVLQAPADTPPLPFLLELTLEEPERAEGGAD